MALDSARQYYAMTDNPSSSSENFGLLFVQHQGQIYGYIRTLAVDRHDADEVLQETAAVLWKKFDQFEPGTNFLAWALAVAHREARSYLRQKHRQGHLLSDSLAELVAADTVHQGAELAGVHEALAGCLGRLADGDRDLIRQRYQREGNIRTLAEHLGRPASTVYNALARIHRKLLNCIQRQLGTEARP